MESPAAITLFLPDESATADLGRWLAARATPGFVLLLEGDIGAGKTHLARAFIRARLRAEVDVPSPTFTLVQTYEDPAGDLWHADLYRLSHPDEVLELGLDGGFAAGICLVEWPDRLGPETPATATRMRLAVDGTGRRAQIITPDADLRHALIQDWPGA